MPETNESRIRAERKRNADESRVINAALPFFRKGI